MCNLSLILGGGGQKRVKSRMGALHVKQLFQFRPVLWIFMKKVIHRRGFTMFVNS